MIKTFAHKGLERFNRSGSKAGIRAIHAQRLRSILALLEQARLIEDMNATGLSRIEGITHGAIQSPAPRRNPE